MRPKKKLFETPPVSSTTFSTWSPKTKVVNKAKELSKFDNHGTMFWVRIENWNHVIVQGCKEEKKTLWKCKCDQIYDVIKATATLVRQCATTPPKREFQRQNDIFFRHFSSSYNRSVQSHNSTMQWDQTLLKIIFWFPYPCPWPWKI